MSAGKSLRKDASLAEEFSPEAIYEYEPVIVKCEPNGKLTWRLAEAGEKTNVKMFCIRDMENFQPAMAAIVKELLTELP